MTPPFVTTVSSEISARGPRITRPKSTPNYSTKPDVKRMAWLTIDRGEAGVDAGEAFRMRGFSLNGCRDGFRVTAVTRMTSISSSSSMSSSGDEGPDVDNDISSEIVRIEADDSEESSSGERKIFNLTRLFKVSDSINRFYSTY